MKVPNGRLSGDGSAKARKYGRAFGDSYLQLYFVCLFFPKFVVLRIICLKHMTETKIFPPKNVFCSPNLKPDYGPDSAKIVSAIRIFCFEGHSASRCSITSKTFFYKSLLGGPLQNIL